MTAEQVYVIRRADGQYFQGTGYGGPGHPVPYWSEDIRTAQIYRTVSGARSAAQRWGGYVGMVETGAEAICWRGFLVRQLGEWRPVLVPPRDFDPNDFEGNNAPIRG